MANAKRWIGALPAFAGVALIFSCSPPVREHVTRSNDLGHEAFRAAETTNLAKEQSVQEGDFIRTNDGWMDVSTGTVTGSSGGGPPETAIHVRGNLYRKKDGELFAVPGDAGNTFPAAQSPDPPSTNLSKKARSPAHSHGPGK